jgi:hypothetical protein
MNQILLRYLYMDDSEPISSSCDSVNRRTRISKESSHLIDVIGIGSSATSNVAKYGQSFYLPNREKRDSERGKGGSHYHHASR